MHVFPLSARVPESIDECFIENCIIVLHSMLHESAIQLLVAVALILIALNITDLFFGVAYK